MRRCLFSQNILRDSREITWFVYKSPNFAQTEEGVERCCCGCGIPLPGLSANLPRTKSQPQPAGGKEHLILKPTCTVTARPNAHCSQQPEFIPQHLPATLHAPPGTEEETEARDVLTPKLVPDPYVRMPLDYMGQEVYHSQTWVQVYGSNMRINLQSLTYLL